MGTFLRLAGGLGFLVLLFLPSVRGCGMELSQVELARGQASWHGPAMLLGAVAFALLAALGALLTKRPSFLSEIPVLLLALLFAAGLVFFADVVLQKGGSTELVLGGQAVALLAVMAGAWIRWKRPPKKT